MNCNACGAPVTARTGRFCSHCDTAVQSTPITADEYRTHADRYAAVMAHPHYTAAVTSPPPISGVGEIAVPAVMLVGGLGVAAVFYRLVGHELSAIPYLPAIAGLILVAWCVVCGLLIYSGIRYHKAPIVPVVAVVVDERMEVSSHGSRDHRRTRTSYFATLQFHNGTRRELPTTDDVAGRVATGDAGVAYSKGGHLVGFHRIVA